jgi:hypothetical protein
MTCAEFQEVLPDMLEGSSNAAQEAHVSRCIACSQLVADINFIAQQAKLLEPTEDPSPRVWNSIEIMLRQEGLIHEPLAEARSVRKPSRRWLTGWALPASAAFLITLGVLYEQNRPTPELAQHGVPTAPTAVFKSQTSSHTPNAVASSDLADDAELLDVVSKRTPTMRASYETELRSVNSYIRDAQNSVEAHPNDEAAQRYLMDAYQQKAMVYQLALDRSLP